MPRTWWPGSTPSGRHAHPPVRPSPNSRSTRASRPRPRRGRHRSPHPEPWPTRRSLRVPAVTRCAPGGQLRQFGLRLLAGRRVGRDGQRLHVVGSPTGRTSSVPPTPRSGSGVTCSADQAWTVEIFGYSPSILPSANARASAQNAVDGNPVAQNPVVAGTPSGDPVYCPGQTDGPNGQISVAGGQVPYPYPCRACPANPAAGRPRWSASRPPRILAGTGWPDRTGRSPPTVTRSATDRWQGQTLSAPIQHIVSTARRKGLLAGGQRRWNLRLR